MTLTMIELVLFVLSVCCDIPVACLCCFLSLYIDIILLSQRYRYNLFVFHIFIQAYSLHLLHYQFTLILSVTRLFFTSPVDLLLIFSNYIGDFTAPLLSLYLRLFC